MASERVPRYSICQAVIRGNDLATDLAWAAAAGASGVALSGPDVDAAGWHATTDLLNEYELQVSTVERYGHSPLTPQPVEEQEAALQQAARMCVHLGAANLLVTTGGLEQTRLSAKEADSKCRTWFSHMAPIASAHGIRLALEPVHPLLRWASYVHTVRHAVDITGGLPGTGVLLDVGHLWWDRHLLDDIEALTEHITSVQIDDVSGGGLRDFRYGRVQLGEGCIPLGELVDAIESAGFQGWYENEIGMRMKREERTTFLAESGRRLSKLLADRTQH